VLDKQMLDENPCSTDLAGGNTAGLRKALQRLGVDLQELCRFAKAKRRHPLRFGSARLRWPSGTVEADGGALPDCFGARANP